MSYETDYLESYRNCQWVPFDLLEDFMRACLMKSGVPEADAATVAEVLIESDRRGIDSHGIGRLKPIYLDRIEWGILNPVTEIEVAKETETTAVLDGHNGMGHVVAKKAMAMAIDKAKNHGLGMVTVRNSTHYGIAGYYATMASDAGMIGVTGTNARPSIAPTHGVENMLGTNPLVFAFPSDDGFPFVLDCATSVSQRGKIEMYERAGKELPPGWVIDRSGETRTDTRQVLFDLVTGQAALAPLGGLGEETAGYKGYGYATVVEVLSAALQEGAFLRDLNGIDEEGRRRPYPLGHFFIAIDIEHFVPLSSFMRIAGTILRTLRSSETAPGRDRIYTAGEKEHLARQIREVHGCPIPSGLQEIIDELREKWSLEYAFPWDRGP